MEKVSVGRRKWHSGITEEQDLGVRREHSLSVGWQWRCPTRGETAQVWQLLRGCDTSQRHWKSVPGPEGCAILVTSAMAAAFSSVLASNFWK